ncbi:hypothetical protein [Psychrobacter sp. bablab_jr014]
MAHSLFSLFIRKVIKGQLSSFIASLMVAPIARHDN